MVGRTTALLGLAALALAAGGCGTVNNLHASGQQGWFGPTAGPRVYGGVRDELWYVVSAFDWGYPPSMIFGGFIVATFGYDFPLTVVGDTVTLPLTAVAEIRRACGLPEWRLLPAGFGLPPGENEPPRPSLPIPEPLPTGPLPGPPGPAAGDLPPIPVAR